MKIDREIKPASRISTHRERARRGSSGRTGALLQRTRLVADAIVEDLSISGCRISTDDEIKIGSLISIEVLGVGMQAARVVRSDGAVHGCEFLLPLSETEVEDALSAINSEPVSLRNLREEAEEHRSRLSTESEHLTVLKKLLSRGR